tara:strand:- start:1839 stop:2099 length:261 start_codon:yes stop_codon:yes gene_type:complete
MNTFIDELKKEHSKFVENNPNAAFVNKLKLKNKKFMLSQSMKRKENTEEDDRLDLYNPHYSDASKYAKEYYGDVYNQTTKWDNEWN